MRTSKSIMTPYALLMATLAAAFGVTASAAVGCTGTIGGASGETGSGAGTGQGGGGGQGGDSAAAANARALYDTNIEPAMVDNCLPCHMANGSSNYPFMAEPYYDTIKGWTGLVIKNYTQSKLLTHPVEGGGHLGTNIDTLGDLEAKMQEWLKAEADAIAAPTVDPSVPLVGPFDVRANGAFSAVRFDTYLGAEYLGISITFTASLSGDVLTLSNVRVNTTQQLGVGWDGLEVQTFAGDTRTTIPGNAHGQFTVVEYPGGTRDFLPPTITINGYAENTPVGFFFTGLKPLTGQDGSTPCADVTSFTTNALAPIQASCAIGNCHGTANSSAADVMDLSSISPENATPDNAVGCQVLRSKLVFSNTAQSQIFVNSDPNGGATHPFKFGNADDFNAFRTAVSIWADAEAAAAP